MCDNQIWAKPVTLQTSGRKHNLFGAPAFGIESSRKIVCLYVRSGGFVAPQIHSVDLSGALGSDGCKLSNALSVQARRNVFELSGEIVVDEQNIHVFERLARIDGSENRPKSAHTKLNNSTFRISHRSKRERGDRRIPAFRSLDVQPIKWSSCRRP
jgi:hypothetical protein